MALIQSSIITAHTLTRVGAASRTSRYIIIHNKIQIKIWPKPKAFWGCTGKRHIILGKIKIIFII